MAVGTADFGDAAARVPARAPLRDTATADAVAARARFGRDLDAATAKDAAQARNVAERTRSEEAVSAGRADRAKVADLVEAADNAAAGVEANAMANPGGAARLDQASPDRGSAPAGTAAVRSDTVDPRRDTAPGRRADMLPRATADAPENDAAAGTKPAGGKAGPAKAEAAAEEGKAADAKAADAKAADAKAADAKGGDAKGGDAKGGDVALATPTIALILGAPVPTRGGVAVAAGAGSANGVAAAGTGPAGTAAGAGLADVAGRAAPAGDAGGEDAVAGTDAASGAATKADLFPALADITATASGVSDLAAKGSAAMDLAVKAQAAPAGTASSGADRAAALPPPVPLGQVPMTIGLRSLAGSSEFQIRLDPLELGRVDVTLDIDKDSGTVTTHLVVERVETLAMLQRDAGNLQQALAQAGLDPSQGGITLSLRSDGGSGGETGRRDTQPSRGGTPGTPSEPAVAEVAPSRALRGPSGLDIRI